MRRYTVLPIPDAEDGGFTATVPTLLGCATEGDTLVEALDHARDAIRLHIEDLESQAEPVPEETVTLALATIEA